MTRRWRTALLAAAAVASVLVLSAVIAVYWLLQPERFTAMLQDQARAAGLDLSLASPASPTLFPRPALELKGITLNAHGAGMPILLAARGRLALPWSTLLGGATVISRLEIDAPRVDLDALQDWFASLPTSPASTTPQIPRIDTGIRISRASVVRGNTTLLDNLALETGQLTPGQTFSLDATARNSRGDPLQLRLLATPQMSGSSLQLEHITLRMVHGPATTLELSGSARWNGAADAAADLTGKLDRGTADSYDIAIGLTPANARDPLLLALKLDGPDNHANLHLPPLALANWWSQLDGASGPDLTLPPGSGHVDAARLELGRVGIEGLQLDLGNDIPAPASSTATPAGSKDASGP